MNQKNRKPLILSALLLAALTSCEISFEIGTSNSSSDNISDTSTENVSNDTTSEFEGSALYNGSIEVKNTDGNSINNNNFNYQNCSVNVATSGTITKDDNGYILGNGIDTGSLTFTFISPIVIDQIDFNVYSHFASSITTNIYINGNQEEITFSKESVGLRLSEALVLNSIKFEGKGIGGRLKFEKINFSLHDEIKVTEINTIKEKEVHVNETFTIDDCYEVLPKNAFNKKVTYSTSSSYVEINGSNLKCLETGEYYVTVTTVDGDFSTDVKITVTEEVIPECATKLSRSDTRFTYDKLFQAGVTEGVIPSVGSPNIIVVPVNFSDLTNVYNFNNSTSINRLNAAFNGTNDDYTNSYSHSLRSFYRESSYGLLDMNFIISDVFVPSFNSSTFVSKESKTDGGGTYSIIEEFYKSGKIGGQKINFKDSKYDINSDGFVDGIWFIYNDNRSSTTDNYWPYTYWYYNLDDEGYIVSGDNNISCYANCSVYFMYEDSSVGEDYHTLVHETGHMLGLDDYYVTDSTNTTSAIGGLDMMDYNVGDHNAFSKYALGWIEPYLLNDEGTITLKPFESSGDCLIIPSSYFNNSAFSEYLVFEYYTPTGLNELDSKYAYPSRDLYFTKNGIRVFHVDARIAKLDYSSSKGYYFSGTYLDENATKIPTSNNSYYMVGASNTPSYSYNGYHLIEAVTADNVKTYNKSSTDNDSLFVQGDVFNPAIYSSFFTNSKLHDGTVISYQFEFTSMNHEGCTIKITKK